MLPSPMAFSPFSSSSRSRNLRTMATLTPMYLSQTRDLKNNIRFMPQKFKKTHHLPSTSLFSASILLPFVLALCLQPLQCSTICDQIQHSLQEQDKPRLQALLEEAQASAHQSCFLQLIPKYYWAQNMTHLMVKFQFLNSADTSACGEVLSVRKTIEHESFSVSLICTMSEIKVWTFMPINFYQVEWKEGQQNTIFLECLKSPSPYFWKSLYTSKHIPPRKPKVWWKLMEKYKQNLKDFFYDLQVDQEEDDISGYVRMRRQVKKSRWWSVYEADSQKYMYCNQNNVFQLGSWVY